MTEVTKLLTHPPQNAAEELQRRLVISALQQHQFPPQLNLTGAPGALGVPAGLTSGQGIDADQSGGQDASTASLIEKSLSIMIDTKEGPGGGEVKKEILDLAGNCDDLVGSGGDDDGEDNDEGNENNEENDYPNNTDQDSDPVHGRLLCM